MDQKTVDAIQSAFKAAVVAFNATLVKALGEKGAVVASASVAPVAALSSAPKRRGRPAKAKPAVSALQSSTPKRRGRPPKKVDVLAKLVAVAPKRRGRPANKK